MHNNLDNLKTNIDAYNDNEINMLANKQPFDIAYLWSSTTDSKVNCLKYDPKFDTSQGHDMIPINDHESAACAIPCKQLTINIMRLESCMHVIGAEMGASRPSI